MEQKARTLWMRKKKSFFFNVYEAIAALTEINFLFSYYFRASFISNLQSFMHALLVIQLRYMQHALY